MVLHNGARFVTNKYPKKGNYENFSISNILKDLNWDSLEERRMQARTSMAFKILNNNVILESELLPKVNNQRPDRACRGTTVGKQNQLFEPQARLDVTRTTFFYATPYLWNNNVTSHQASLTSIDAFKSNFKKR